MSQTHKAPKTYTLHVWTKPVHYRWPLLDGTMCHGSTVVLARTRGGLRQALKRFWVTNPHVSPDAA